MRLGSADGRREEQRGPHSADADGTLTAAPHPGRSGLRTGWWREVPGSSLPSAVPPSPRTSSPRGHWDEPACELEEHGRDGREARARRGASVQPAPFCLRTLALSVSAGRVPLDPEPPPAPWVWLAA